MSKKVISISLDEAVLSFWDARLAAVHMNRSAWLSLLLVTWSDNNRDPLVMKICDDGREMRVKSGGGFKIPPTQAAAARREASLSNKVEWVSPELHAARNENARALAAYREAVSGPRLAPAVFARIKEAYYAASDRLAKLERDGE